MTTPMQTPEVQHVSLIAATGSPYGSAGLVRGVTDGSGFVALSVALTAQDTSTGSATVLITEDDGTDGNLDSDLVLVVSSHGRGWNGTGFDRLVSASKAVQSVLTNKLGVAITAKATEWTETNDPAANTQATCSRAAAVGVQHVVTGLTVCLAAGAAVAGPVKVRLLEGATTRWVGALACVVQGSAAVFLDNLAIIGAANTAFTLQFDAAGGAGSFETVTLTGYSLTT